MWSRLFGTGLVRTLDDFGTSGESPSHPALLDWLATEFMRRGWSRKELIRLIVTSATYRQSPAHRDDLAGIDPLNRLLARQNRLRLEAEVLRDAALRASGLLTSSIGGPSIRPPLPGDIYDVGRSVKWEVSQGHERYRRGMYILTMRSLLYPMLTTFDAPDAADACVRRDRSNTPLQALTMMNDPVFVEAAQALALRVIRESPGGPAERLRHVFRLCLGREPCAEEAGPGMPTDPLTARKPHFAPKAERCIFIFLEGGPSQMDLFDPKPMLNQYDGRPLPPSIVGDAKFAFLQKDTATVMGTKRVFRKHGQCGMEISDLLPHIATCADDIALIRSVHTTQFNHLPGQLMLNCGAPLPGRPSVGSWVTYGLGNGSQELPSYVVMVSKGRGLPGGSSTWSSGFLPSSYGGVMFRNGSSPVLNLANPEGITAEMQKESLGVLNDLNRLRHRHIGDPEIASRISSYELAFRMQSAAPELVDLGGESQATLDAYGIHRTEPPIKSNLGGIGNFQIFSRQCLQARRMVERGVRYVNIIHASWDHHSNLDPQLAHNCLMVDQPISALLKDLKQRGLLDTTLVVWGSEFGRTALGENRPGFKKVTGRDHHPAAFSLWMAGGGVKGGQVHGETDDFAWHVARDPVSMHDFHATLLHLFGLDDKRLTYRFQGRDFRLTDVHGEVVKSLLA